MVAEVPIGIIRMVEVFGLWREKLTIGVNLDSST